MFHLVRFAELVVVQRIDQLGLLACAPEYLKLTTVDDVQVVCLAALLEYEVIDSVMFFRRLLSEVPQTSSIKLRKEKRVPDQLRDIDY